MPVLAARKWGTKLLQQGGEKKEISFIQEEFADQLSIPGALYSADSHGSTSRTEFGLERHEGTPKRAFIASVFNRLSLLPGSW